MKTQREIEIDAYIKQHPTAKFGSPLPVVYHGRPNSVDVFRIPTRLLIFNIANGRFAAELIEEQRKLRRKLDPLNEEDAKIIRRFLLEQNLCSRCRGGSVSPEKNRTCLPASPRPLRRLPSQQD